MIDPPVVPVEEVIIAIDRAVEHYRNDMTKLHQENELLRAELGQCMQDNGDWTYEIQCLSATIEKLRTAILWISPPFVDENTPEAELRQRISFCVQDAKKATKGTRDE